MRVRIALLVLAASCVCVTAGDSSSASAPWSESELRTLRSLSIDSLGRPPHDPSNRYADLVGAAALGHRLFFDPRLSRNGEISCATCHDPGRYFTDGRPRAEGIGRTRRGAPTLIGSSHSPWLYWDGRSDSQWSQALEPLEGAAEMGSSRLAVARVVAGDRFYREAYVEIFGELPDMSDTRRFPLRGGPLGNADERGAWERMNVADRETINRLFTNVGKAIAAYERKLLPGASRFDTYVARLAQSTSSSPAPLTDEEIAGLRVFTSPESGCLRCHNGPLFTNHGFHNVGVPLVEGSPRDYGRQVAIEQVLSSEFNCLGPYSDANPEQCVELKFVKKEGEELPGAFKVPTLRNVAETAPYLHTGQFGTLSEVLRHYGEPARAIGHLELSPARFTEIEMRHLESFLGTLTSPVAAAPHWLVPPAPRDRSVE